MQNEYVIILVIVAVIVGIWYKKHISNTCSNEVREENQIQIIDDGGKPEIVFCKDDKELFTI